MLVLHLFGDLEELCEFSLSTRYLVLWLMILGILKLYSVICYIFITLLLVC